VSSQAGMDLPRRPSRASFRKGKMEQGLTLQMNSIKSEKVLTMNSEARFWIMIVIFVGAIAFLISFINKHTKLTRRLTQLGYKCYSFNTSVIWMKDGVLYNIPEKKPKNAMPLDVISLSEITENTILVGLEIRYRENGVLKSLRLMGSSSNVLEIIGELVIVDP
jgi:cellobiose-specific phosphotransferase system component IIC